jgi:hypothetical protein
LAGLTEVPAYLAEARTGELGELPEPSRREIDGERARVSIEPRVVFDTADLRSRIEVAGVPTRARFSVRMPSAILDRLVEAADVSEVVSHLSSMESGSAWQFVSEEYGAAVTTPLGFTFRVDVELHDERRPRTLG